MTDPYLYQPREVSLETLALCNARCTFCPYPTLNRKGVEMSSALIDRLIREMATWTAPFSISPFKVNEPLLDKRLPAICEAIEAQVPAARIRLFTNGSPLTPEQVNWIAKLKNLEHLWVSLNEVDSVRYIKLMGLHLDLTVRRLDMLHARMMAYEFTHPVIVSRVTDGNGVVQTEHDRAFMMFCLTRWPLFKPHLIKRDGWLGYVSPSHPDVPNMPCGRWWELNVMATGIAALCCMDGTGEYSIGDVAKSSLLDVYNQVFLIDRRTQAMSRFNIFPCNQCTY